MLRLQRKWQVVVVLFFIAAINYADRAAISAVFPLLRSGLQASDLALAAIGSVFLWAYAMGSPIAGYLADRLSRSRMVVCSLTAWSLVTILSGFAPNIETLLITRALLGVAECAYLPAALALIADHHKDESRGTAMGIHLAGLNFGLVGGGAVSGYIAEHLGWRLDFFVIGSAGLVLSLIAHVVLRDGAGRHGPAPAVSPWRSARAIFRIPSVLVVLAEAMLVSIATWMFFNWLPLFFKEHFSMSLAEAGFSGTFALQIAATVGVIGGGYLSDRVAGSQPGRRLLILGLCYLFSTPFLLAFLRHAGYDALSASIFSYSLIRALGSSNEGPIFCDLLAPHLRSTAFGLMNTLNCFAGGAGILVAGYFKKDFGLSGIFAGCSLVMALAGLIAIGGYVFFAKKDLAKLSRITEETELEADPLLQAGR